MEIEGAKIVEVRPMTRKELKAEGWEIGRHGAPAVVVLDNGAKLYASQDSEGNGPGALFVGDSNGGTFQIAIKAVGG